MRTFRTSYQDRGGKQRQASKWYVEYRDHAGMVRRVPGFRDRRATDELGRKLERLAALRAARQEPDRELSMWIEGLPARLLKVLSRQGMLDACRIAAARPLSELIAEWETSLSAGDRASKTVAQTVERARRVLEGAGARYWSEIAPARVERYLRAERDRENGISAQTSNHLLGAARQFIGWAVKRGLAGSDPLRVLGRLNVATDRRRMRRALEPEEARALLSATERGPVRCGLAGPARATLYALALATGLRKGELESLTFGSFDLNDHEHASVTVSARASKHRREDTLPLVPAVARALQQHLRGRLPTARAFELPAGKSRKGSPISLWRAAEMLAEDLAVAHKEMKAAKVEVPVDPEAAVDFHCLRHSTASYLARAGVAPRIAQAIMRHSDIRLTMNVYSHLGANDERDALRLLPDLSLPIEPAAKRATGTEDEVSWRSAWRSESPIAADAGRSMPLGNSENADEWRTRRDSNPQPSVPKTDALSS